MALDAGARVGPYEISAQIGAGGMGEVYRARDINLGRDVAIKVLPDAFARDAERLARFEREAKTLASLNHVNIAHVYGLERVEPAPGSAQTGRALVMELVEGPTLADRIAQGAIPLDESLLIAKQIADALEAAHDQGIIHRDLKPVNVKVRDDGTVKVLDFGLAKPLGVDPSGAMAGGATQSPTITSPAMMTGAGVILGTAAYMAPEQARGKPADKRADIWAFGCVLYEMLTGRRLFLGEDVSETLAAVLKEEPTLDDVPAHVRSLLRRCVRKDPKARLRDIGDAWALLESSSPTLPVVAGANRFTRLAPWLTAAVLASALVAVLVILWPPARVERPLMHLRVDLGPDAMRSPLKTISISPDGTRIAYPTRTGQTVTRLLEESESTPVPGTSATAGYFSRDGQWIGFFNGTGAQRIAVRGGAPVPMASITGMRGMTWLSDGTVVASVSIAEGSAYVLARIPANGGKAETLTKTQAGRWHVFPQVLPGERAVLFTSSAPGDFENGTISVLSLETGLVTDVWRGGYFARYLPTRGASGHFVYVSRGTLFGIFFDPATYEIRGTPAPLIKDLGADPLTGTGQFDVSESGTLVYLPSQAPEPGYPVLVLAGSGKTTPLLSRSGIWGTPRFSPDGTLLALFESRESPGIYVYDWRRELLSRIRSGVSRGLFGVEMSMTWAPDSRHLVVASRPLGGEGTSSLLWIRNDGAMEPETLLQSDAPVSPASFSPDGSRLMYTKDGDTTRTDLWSLPLDFSDPAHPKAGKPELFLATPVPETQGRFSPDGKWVAYTSFVEPRGDIEVRPFDGRGSKLVISTAGGSDPHWSRTSRVLFYRDPEGRIMVVDYIIRDGEFVPTAPRVWSDVPVGNERGDAMSLHPDGRRFAVFPARNAQQPANLHATFLINFHDEVRRRIP